MKIGKLRFIDLFAGIGGMRIPFEELGGKCVFTSEVDPSCQKMYESNFGEIPYGDICEIKAKDIPNHDLLLAGFPCQSFSIIGNGHGFADTRGTLFFEIKRILKVKKPHAFLLENVKQLKSHDKGKTFKVIMNHLHELGYYVHWKILNALHYGVPQKRERIFIVGFKKNYVFRFPPPTNECLSLEAVLEDDAKVDKKHFASKGIAKSRQNKVKNKKVLYPSIWHENKAGNIGIHPYSCALRAGASYNYLLINGVRRPTPRENLRLQGFPDSFKIVVTDSQVRKQAGNSVAISCVSAIAKEMIKAMSENIIDENKYYNMPEQMEFA